MTQPVLFIKQGACSLGSQIMLEFLKVPYSVCITDDQFRKSAEFRKISPKGTVGALKDGDINIMENLAILFHLSDKYGKLDGVTTFKLASAERAKAYQWLSYISSTLHIAFGQFLFTKHENDQQKELARQKLLGVFGYINDFLSSSKYFVGDKTSFVDGQAYALLRWANLGMAKDNNINIGDFPHILDFINRMEKLPEVENARAIEANQPEKLSNTTFTGYWPIPA